MDVRFFYHMTIHYFEIALWHENNHYVHNVFRNTNTKGDQKVRGKVLLNRIAFIDCNEKS